MDGQPIFITFAWATQKGRLIYSPSILTLNLPENIGVATILESSIKSSSAARFFVFRFFVL
jgi:hypothetical protein